MTARQHLLASAAMVAALSPSSAWAAEAAENEGPAAFEDIVVTATKRATDMQDTPISVSVIGGEALQSGGVQRLSDITDALPNVRLPDALNPGNAAIRGISSQARATARVESPVGAYLDEVFVGGKFLNGFLFDIDRIEVIRGPQGTLWGRNTAAGAISYVTRRPTREFEAYGEATYGNYDLALFRGAVSGPLIEETLSYRLAVGHMSRDGYDERVSGGTFGKTDVDGVRGQLLIRPSDRLDIRLIAGYTQTDSFPRSQVYFAGPFAIGGSGSRRADTNDRSFAQGEAKQYNFAAHATYDIGGIELTSVSGYNALKSYYRYDEDGTSTDFVVSFFGRPDRPETSEQFSQELRLSSSGKTLEYTLGAYVFNLSDYNSTTNSYSDFLAPAITEEPRAFIFEQDNRSRQRTSAYAVFGQGDYHLTEALTATFGFRLNDERKTFKVDAAGSRIFDAAGTLLVSTPAGAYRSLPRFKDSVATAMGGLKYQFTDDVMAYATYSEGYKSGGFNTDAAVNPAISATFGPESTVQYELGLRTSLLDRRLILNATAFWMNYDNLQIEEFVGLNVQVGNAGKARSRGVELEMVARPGENWAISASAAYLDAKFLKFSLVQPDGTIIFDRDGNRLPFAPEFSSSVNVRREIPIGDGRLFASGEWIYSSAYFTEPNNSGAGRQPAYHTFNARLGFKPDGDRWEVALWGRNLTDQDIRVDFNDALPAFFGGSVFEVLAPPRTYGLEATYRF